MYSRRNVLLACGASGAVGAYVGSNGNDFLSFEFAYLNRLKNYILPTALDYRNSPESFLKKATSISDSMKYAVLSTHNGSEISSRAVQPFKVELNKDGNPEIFFNTNRLSRKYTEMMKDPAVSLAYLDQRNMACVTYTGTVQKIPYPESTKHWEDWLLMFYPEGNNENNGARFSTWKLTPSRVHMIHYHDGISSERYDSRPPEVAYDKEKQEWMIACTGAEKNNYT